MKIEKEKYPRKKRQIEIQISICANCKKEFEDSDFGKLSRLIMKQKPVCSFECNKALGQVK